MADRDTILALLATDPPAGLKAAAQLIRETAQAATPAPWKPSPQASDAIIAPAAAELGPDTVTDYMRWYGGRPLGESIAAAGRAHIVSWSPPPALAVADWLQEVGAWPRAYPNTRHPVAVARAWLTGQAPA